MTASRRKSRNLRKALVRPQLPRMAKYKPTPSRLDRGLEPVGGFKNQLSYLDQHRAMLATIAAGVVDAPTGTLAVGAGLPTEEALGALKMLEYQGHCYSRSGGRSQLLWSTGTRPADVRPPLLVQRDRRRYETVVSTLRWASNAQISTDELMRQAAVPDRHRKALRGGLKALVALDLVQHGKYGRQAIVWQWIGPGGHGHQHGRAVVRDDRGNAVAWDDVDVAQDAAAFRDWQARMDAGEPL
jgi:hypothetical protein